MLRRRITALFTVATILAVVGCSAARTVPRTRGLDAQFVVTPSEVVDAMLKVAKVGENDVVYDLGCGDGRIVIAAARDYGARGVGIDIDPKRIAEARENAKKAGVTERVTFREEDLFEADIRDATVVTLFLLPRLNLKLRPRLLSNLKPGTRIVSHAFDMGDWKPEAMLVIPVATIARTRLAIGDLESQERAEWGREQMLNVEGRRVYLWTVPKPAGP